MLSARSFAVVACGSLLACSTYTAIDITGRGISEVAGASSLGAGGTALATAGGSNSGGTATGGTATGGTATGGTETGGEANGAAPPSEAGAGPGGAPADGGSPVGGSDGQSAVMPSAVTLAPDTVELARNLNESGTLYAERCPDDQVLIGFQGTVDAPGGATYLRSAQAICGALSVTSSPPYEVKVIEAEALPMREIASAQFEAARCPVNQVMIGFAGRSGLWMDSVDVRCAPLSILGVAPTYLLVSGTPATAGTIGGATGGSPFDPMECEAGQVAVGQVVRTIYSGQLLGAFGVQCAKLELVTRHD